MQRHKLGTRINPGEGSSSPQPSQAWQVQDSNYGGIKLYNPNAMSQHHPDSSTYVANQQSLLANPAQLPSQGTESSQASQWDWTNGGQHAPVPNTCLWENSQPHQPTMDHNPQFQYSQQAPLPRYDPSSNLFRPQQQAHWATPQPQTQATVHRSFSEVWNWGGESEASVPSNVAPSATQESQGDFSQQLRQGPDGQDQWTSTYPNWNSSQQTQYMWNQSNQQFQPSYQMPGEMQSSTSWQYSAPAEGDRSTEGNTLLEHRDVLDGQAALEGNQPANFVQPSPDVYHTMQPNVANSQPEMQASSSQENTLLDSPSKTETNTQETMGLVEVGKSDTSGTVATFFQCGDDEDSVEILESPHEQVVMQGADISKVNPLDQSNPPTTELESLGPGSLLGRAPYLRCDSWISNSSLLTYNHSTTGSQEFLSGSYFGEDGPPSIGAISGLCHSIDDMHLSSPRSLPHHLLHQHHQHPALRRRRSSVEEQVLSLPLDATNTLDIFPVASDIRRSSLPNVAVVAGEEVVPESLQALPASNENNLEMLPIHHSAIQTHTSTKDAPSEVNQIDQTQDQISPGVNWSQECATNIEVPPIAITDASLPATLMEAGDKLSTVDSGTMILAENVEVVPSATGTVESQPPIAVTNSGSYKMSVWSREGSAFQPLPPRTPMVTPVIQREVPDLPPSNDDLSDGRDEALCEHPKTEPESANLETVPDNVERPLDADVSEMNKKIRNRSPLHSSFTRQHLRETHNSSPAASLWENPELARDFSVVLAPAVLPTNSHSVPAQQSALLVPHLQNQQELLDNPLGVTLTDPQPVLVKSASPPSMTTVKDKQEPQVSHTPTVSAAERCESEVSARSSKSPPSAPLDLSSRAAPQGWSAADDDIQVIPPRLAQQAQVPTTRLPLPQSGRPEESDRRHYDDDRITDESERRHPPRTSSRDDYSANRSWNDRNAYVADRGDDYDHRNARRTDFPPAEPRSERERNRDWERDRDRQQVSDTYYQNRYDSRSDRDRSRPSSRSSNQDYDANGRERYYDRSRYPPLEDTTGRGPGLPPRPSSLSGYESDQGSGRQRQPDYVPYQGDYYQRDPRYSAAYGDYYRYARDRYDPRQYSQYMDANQYNYGYYAELYGSDPRYRAYYDSLAKDYYWQYGSQYQYEDYDRRSVHSGRSSVTDDSQKENDQFSNAFHGENPNRDPSVEVAELSTIYPQQDNLYYPQGVDVSSEYSEPMQPGPSSASESVPVTPLQRLTPAKFSFPHVRATFSPSGHLIVLPPNSIADGQVAVVEICDFQGVFVEDFMAQELNSFPSPLIRGETHKNDVIQYCLQKIRKAKDDEQLPDRDSCILIWELLVLLIRQNGVVVGTDIAELLLHDQNLISEKANSPVDTPPGDSAELLSPDDGVVLADDNKPASHGAVINDESNDKFIEFLLFGHKKDALEWAMKRGLWGHALFLASKMDSRTYAMVMTRFANSLAFNDPLQTLYQLMSGRQPAAVTCIADEKWGDWRPHLAIILSNPTHRPDLDRRSVITLGDTLAGRGYLHAAHFCYLMAQVEFGNFDKKSSKLVLIGANQSLPFSQFATIEAIKCTEVYEYVQALANPHYVLPHLQFYKFIYAARLAEHGRPQEALHYCEVITRAIQKMPALYNVELVHQVYELAYRLKYFDPYYTQEEGEIVDMGDPIWVRELQTLLQSYSDGTVQPVTEYSDVAATMNSAASLSQQLVDYSMQNTALDTPGIQANVLQQENSYASHEQATNVDTSQQYSNYSENSQQSIGYADYGNIHPANLSGQAAHQQNYGESYYEKTVPQMAEEYAQQNIVNSQYDYYGTAIHSQTENSVPEYSDLADGTSSLPPDNVDYYSASTYKNSLPPSSTSADVPSGKPTVTDNSKSSKGLQKDKLKSKKTDDKSKVKQGGSWLGGIFSKFSLKPQNQMILPDDKNPTLIWDATANRWVSSDGDEVDENSGPVAPPKDLELSTNPRPATMGAMSPPTESVPTSVPSAPLDENRFKLRHGRGMKHNYVDVLGGSTVPVSSSIVPPQLLPNVGTTSSQAASQAAPQFFIPAPVVDSESTVTDFITTAPGGQLLAQVGNPASRGGSSQDETDPDDASQNETVSQGQPLMFNPSQMGQAATTYQGSTMSAGPKGGLQKYGRRYPR